MISTTKESPWRPIRTLAWSAVEWRSTLVSPSCTMRKLAWCTTDGMGVARAAHFQVDIQPGSSDVVDEVTQVGQLRWAEGSVSTVIVPKHLEGGTQLGRCVRRGRGDVVEHRDLARRRLLVSEVGGS